MLTSKWATTWNVIFHAEIWFHKPDMLWRTHAWLCGHLTLTEESSGQYQCDDVVSAKQILPKNFDKTANMTAILKENDQSEFISCGPVSLISCVC